MDKILETLKTAFLGQTGEIVVLFMDLGLNQEDIRGSFHVALERDFFGEEKLKIKELKDLVTFIRFDFFRETIQNEDLFLVKVLIIREGFFIL